MNDLIFTIILFSGLFAGFGGLFIMLRDGGVAIIKSIREEKNND